MIEYDYSGDMDYYQKQLAKVGVTKDEIDMGNYVGLTARELQSIVNAVVRLKKEKKA